ncbi:hypothetical protein [Planktotalea sp.]|uniref:hypothetical protein n=1 Tax=Planktotalea sp. TaxID=2029877 RepID=UPI0032991BA2
MSLARAADQAFKLALRVGSIRQSRLELSDMVEQLDENWALFPLIHDDGSIGAMCIDPATNTAFVEQQTLGRVNAATSTSRKLTRTDKALALPFSDKFLRLFDKALEGAPTGYWTRGYRTEDAVETRHLMVLLLDASEYRGFEMSSEIAGSDRKSLIRLFLPMKEPVQPKSLKSNKKDKEKPAKARPKLRNAALAASVEVDAIMCKITIPLTELHGLKEGQLLPLPKNAAQSAKLQDKIGQTALPVRLGQLHGMRAVRLAQSYADVASAQEALPDTVARGPDVAQKSTTSSPEEVSADTPPERNTSGSGDELDDLLAIGKG